MQRCVPNDVAETANNPRTISSSAKSDVMPRIHLGRLFDRIVATQGGGASPPPSSPGRRGPRIEIPIRPDSIRTIHGLSTVQLRSATFTSLLTTKHKEPSANLRYLLLLQNLMPASKLNFRLCRTFLRKGAGNANGASACRAEAISRRSLLNLVASKWVMNAALRKSKKCHHIDNATTCLDQR
ncbi:hypothetical protein Pla144_03680 [Bythopirellula polymerisocia]|uniref:Uncharacterized protein n=1 Tax=Bythopirellula polymerisocia TaxID=2528003 RepID=A0A5C6CYF1_9BACT|nr:hypothetical protein Pla144_03680 [Bythopirellula polymerisocia]